MIILGSLAKGTEDQVKALVDVNVLTYIFDAFLLNDEPKFTEACLRCICTILQFPFADNSIVFSDVAIVRKLIKTINDSISNSICTMSILSCSCHTIVHQNILWEEGIGLIMNKLLNMEIDDLTIATLKCFARVCQDNPKISTALQEFKVNDDDKPLTIALDQMQASDRPTIMRLASSKCITYLYRAGALEARDEKVKFGALPTLVRLCQNDQEWKYRVEAAEILAVLIEDDAQLQSLASISNHLLQTLAEFVNYPSQCVGKFGDPNGEHKAKEMKQAAFKV